MEDTTDVVIPDNNMNPTNQPVSFYGDNSRNTDSALLAAMATKDYFNPVDEVAAGGICDLRAEVSNNRWIIKDAESEIRRDIAKSESEIRAEVLKEGQENLRATKDAECSLSKEILETRHTLAKDVLRAEYENKLAIQSAIKEINANAQHNQERLFDKVDHENEELLERFNECCCEAEVRGVEQTGLLNIIANALNVGGLRVK